MLDGLEPRLGVVAVSPHPVLDAPERDFEGDGNGRLRLSFENPLNGKTSTVLAGLGIGDRTDKNGCGWSTHAQRYGDDADFSKRIENDPNNCK